MLGEALMCALVTRNDLNVDVPRAQQDKCEDNGDYEGLEF